MSEKLFRRTSVRATALLSAALLSSTFAAGFAHATTVTSGYDTSNGTGTIGPAAPGDAITRAQIIDRANDWMNIEVPYSQTEGWQDSATGGPYRMDCSGFVSMAWGLTTSLVTSTLPSVSTVTDSNITGDTNLNPGDALDYTADHVVLFDHWTDSSGDFAYDAEHTTGQVTNQSTDNIDNSTLEGYAMSDFEALQYKNIATTPTAPTSIAVTPTEEESIGGQYTTAPQAAAIGQDGLVYFDTVGSNGSWTGWQRLAGFNGATNFSASAVTIATLPDGSSQIAAIGLDGNIYHNVRSAGGSWAGWEPLAGFNGATHFTAGTVSITGMPDGSSQIVGTGLNGDIYQNIRSASGSWQGWEPLAGFNGATTFNASAVATTAMPDGSSQTVAVGQDGNVYHDIRNANGSWQGWEPLAGYNGATHFGASGLSITGMPNGSSQIVAIGLDGMIYQNSRTASGTWAGWVPVAGTGGAAHFGATNVAITALSNGSSETLTAQSGTQELFDNTLSSSGTWAGWDPLAGYNGSTTFDVK